MRLAVVGEAYPAVGRFGLRRHEFGLYRPRGCAERRPLAKVARDRRGSAPDRSGRPRTAVLASAASGDRARPRRTRSTCANAVGRLSCAVPAAFAADAGASGCAAPKKASSAANCSSSDVSAARARASMSASNFSALSPASIASATTSSCSFFDVRAHEDARIADVFPGRVVALDEPFEDAKVALDLLLLRMSDEVPDVRLALLSVPVDAPVALLELQQRPGDVEVDQLVREVVEVQPLGREVRGQEDADRLLFDAEVGDDLLDLDVRAWLPTRAASLPAPPRGRGP